MTWVGGRGFGGVQKTWRNLWVNPNYIGNINGLHRNKEIVMYAFNIDDFNVFLPTCFFHTDSRNNFRFNLGLKVLNKDKLHLNCDNLRIFRKLKWKKSIQWYVLLPPRQNDWWIVDARFKMRWSIIHTITTGTSTILQKIAQWESSYHSGTDGVIWILTPYPLKTWQHFHRFS